MIMRFIELLTKNIGYNLAECSSVAEQQNFAADQLLVLLDKSNFHSLKSKKSILKKGKHLLLGIASYSVSDLELLDTLNNAIMNKTLKIDRVDVFDVRNCRRMEDFEKYIPSIGKVYQTPVIGIWENYFLKKKLWGYSARELLTKMM